MRLALLKELEPAQSTQASASELGKLLNAATRVGVLLASVANNVMTSPRNAGIVALIVLAGVLFHWLWKQRAKKAAHGHRLQARRFTLAGNASRCVDASASQVLQASARTATRPKRSARPGVLPPSMRMRRSAGQAPAARIEAIAS